MPATTPTLEFATSRLPYIGGHFRAYVLRAIDGDTLDLVPDLGFGVCISIRVRLLGINTPELNAQDPVERARAAAAYQRVSGVLKGQVVEITSHRAADTDKYGRYLVEVFLADGRTMSQLLLDEGLADPYP